MTKEELEQLRMVIQEENEPLKQGQARLEKAVEPVYNRLNSLDQGLNRVEQTQVQSNTAINALKAGHDDIRKEIKSSEERTKTTVKAEVEDAKSELKADVYMLNSNLIKKVQRHERRITNLEEHTGASDVTKS